MISGLSSPLLVVVFVAAAGPIWLAGRQRSDQTDVLATRLNSAIVVVLYPIGVAGLFAIAGHT